MDAKNSQAKKLNVIFPGELLEKLNEAAKATNMTWSEYIRQAVSFKIKNDDLQARIQEQAYQELVQIPLMKAKQQYL